MIHEFSNAGTRDVFLGADTKAARRCCPHQLWKVARRKLDQLNQAATLADLQAPPANRLEKLRHDRAGQHSIRINEQYRVCFAWTAAGPTRVAIVDYHD